MVIVVIFHTSNRVILELTHRYGGNPGSNQEDRKDHCYHHRRDSTSYKLIYKNLHLNIIVNCMKHSSNYYFMGFIRMKYRSTRSLLVKLSFYCLF